MSRSIYVAESTWSGDHDGGGQDVFQSGTHVAESMRRGEQDRGGPYVFHSITSEGREVLGQSVDLCVPPCVTHQNDSKVSRQTNGENGDEPIIGVNTGRGDPDGGGRDVTRSWARTVECMVQGERKSNVDDFEADELLQRQDDKGK